MSIYDQVLARLPNKEIAVTKDVVALTCAIILEWAEENLCEDPTGRGVEILLLSDLKQLLKEGE